MSFDIAEAMKVFINVAECGSFVEAARTSYISNSSISKKIQELEEYLNKQLIVRSTRSLSLTPEGELYLKLSKKIIEDINDANIQVKNFSSSDVSGTVKISIPGFFQHRGFAHLLKEFIENNPNIVLHINNDPQPNQLINKAADIVISELNVMDNQLNREFLFKSVRSVFAAPSYLEKYGTPRTVFDLKHHNCLTHLKPNPKLEWLFANDIRVKVSGSIVVLGGTTNIAAAVEGVGLIWVPKMWVTEELNNGSLVKVDIEPGSYVADVYMYHLPVNYTGCVKIAIDWIRNKAFNFELKPQPIMNK